MEHSRRMAHLFLSVIMNVTSVTDGCLKVLSVRRGVDTKKTKSERKR